jgi:hypothetical protein
MPSPNLFLFDQGLRSNPKYPLPSSITHSKVKVGKPKKGVGGGKEIVYNEVQQTLWFK